MKWITQPARSFFPEWFWSIKLIFEDYWLRSSEFSDKKGWSFCISFILIYQSGLHCLFYLKPAFIRFIICWNCFIFSSTAFLSLTSMVVLLRITREGINKHPLMMNWGLHWGKERKLNYLQISDSGRNWSEAHIQYDERIVTKSSPLCDKSSSGPLKSFWKCSACEWFPFYCFRNTPYSVWRSWCSIRALLISQILSHWPYPTLFNCCGTH